MNGSKRHIFLLYLFPLISWWHWHGNQPSVRESPYHSRGVNFLEPLPVERRLKVLSSVYIWWRSACSWLWWLFLILKGRLVSIILLLFYWQVIPVESSSGLKQPQQQRPPPSQPTVATSAESTTPEATTGPSSGTGGLTPVPPPSVTSPLSETENTPRCPPPPSTPAISNHSSSIETTGNRFVT